jgi:urease subunit alpha
MGDPNASIPTPQPVHYRPMFGSAAARSRDVAHLRVAGGRRRIAERRYGLAKRIVPVQPRNVRRPT